MAGALSFTEFFSIIADLIAHWNSDPVSLGVLSVLALMVSGYFYGRVYQKFIPALKNADCTFLGIFTIIGIFQLAMYFFVWRAIDTEYALILLMILVGLGPVLAVITWSNIVPSWKHLFSFVLGILICIVLVAASSQWTITSMYFDSVTYLSQTVESSTASFFARMDYNRGMTGNFISDPLHDFNSYYYFWGMILRWLHRMFSLRGTLAPIYIWGATALYGMGLGNLFVSSVNVLYKEKKHVWFGILAALLIASPYYTNYWNTDLAFFGNTMRTLGVGYMCLLVYLALKHEDALIFAALGICSFANIAFSSSALFLVAFIDLGVFFAMCLLKENKPERWMWFAASLFPLVQYGVMMILPYRMQDLFSTLAAVGFCAVLCGIVWLLRKHLKVLRGFGIILVPVTVLGLAAASWFLPGEYGYEFFFETRSLHDMTVNMTGWLSRTEMIRNIIFYVLLAAMVLNIKKDAKYKLYLLLMILIGINPLVQPVISNTLTGNVYSRMFDILTNPFTLVFLVYSFDSLCMKVHPVSWIGLTAAGAYCVYTMAVPNLTQPYTLSMTPKVDDYNWKYKSGDDALEMYNYIQNNISIPRDGYWIMSQCTDLKGFVSGVKITFGAADYRDVLADLEAYEGKPEYDMVTLLYPNRRFASDNVRDIEVDYSKLDVLLEHFKSDYLLISNTIAVWDERGWYNKSYQSLINQGVCSLVHENDTWALLKIDQDRLQEIRDEKEAAEENNAAKTD